MNEVFLNSYYMETLEKYCQKFGKRFDLIVEFYEQNPASEESIMCGRGIKLLDRIKLKPVLGVEIKEAIQEVENPTV